jgi:ATP-dependent helicase YprA (DUF1998 family)
MNPIHVTERLKSTLVRYLLTTFDVNRDGENAALYHALQDAFERDKALITGPFLELSLPYVRGESMRQMVERGVLSQRMLRLHKPPIPVDAPLYQHQQQAIERITAGHSVIVSSGTGSGKTESFMIPILNDLLESRARGVRAVLIYPLNALVNDQLERLGRLLEGTGITYGRYTSELHQTTKEWLRETGRRTVPELEVISREQIRSGEKIPNILITNYAMLEYLLLRPDDAGLFAHPDDWRYLVLDEAHSYSGAKGIEVAYLIRRLKQRLGKQTGEMVCIGTSATLTDDKSEAIPFAEMLFGETFTENDIIFGRSLNDDEPKDEAFYPPLEAYLRQGWDDLLTGLREHTTSPDEMWDTLDKFGMIDPDHAEIFSEDLPARLYGALINNGHLRRLRAEMMRDPDAPISITDAAKLVFPESQSTPAQVEAAKLALYHLVELGAVARRTPDSPALLPARYHLFTRSPQGMWACLNPNCQARPEGHDKPWSKLFANPRVTCDVCECAVFPLSVCRTCGQVYVKTFYSDGQHWGDEQSMTQQGGSKQSTGYYTWSQPKTNQALADPDDDDEKDETPAADKPATNPTKIADKPMLLCVNPDCRRSRRCECARQGRTAHHVALYAVVDGSKKTRNDPEPVERLECCARCGSEARMKDDEIATPITMRGTTPLSVITMELYRQLPESRDENIRGKPGGGRKLLSFYDSRQGAARYAAFLQDVFNQDMLRFLVPDTVRALHSRGRGIDVDALAKEGAKIGWDELGVLKLTLDDALDDEDIYNDRCKGWEKLTQAERDKLIDFLKARITAEITVNRRGRQSLESLGLLVVRYFETPPDMSALAGAIGLSEAQTRTLIAYLLDTVRDQKCVRLPAGVEADNPVFGRNKVNKALVRGNADTRSAPWMGSTERHIRCRIMEMALREAGQAHDLESVKRALGRVWDWLIDPEVGLLVGREVGQYQLALHRLSYDTPEDGWMQCDRCQRMRHGAPSLPCPAARCGGTFQPMERSQLVERNYYHYVFRQGMQPMRVEEHTAQLDPKRAQEYQEKFKDGDINVLSCSTTFEMGIDLGDLQVVVMNNVPPNVANYRQRAGRAGRRAGGTAFIVTWAQDRPHDQIYYEQPTDIIRGQVRIPRLTLRNPEIRRRHLNAVLLSDFLRWLHGQNASDLNRVGAFFDEQASGGRHYDRLDDWLAARRLALKEILDAIAGMIGDDLPPEKVQAAFRRDLAEAEAFQRASSTHYKKEIDEAKREYAAASGTEADNQNKRRQNAEGLLKRLHNEQLIDWLSGRGVLPSYSFPLYTVELELPPAKQDTVKLRLQRDLSRAITEFAPGAEVVADKRLWVSDGVRFVRDTPQIFAYRLCGVCNHMQAEETPGAPFSRESCPICSTPYTGRETRFLVPDAFRTDGKQSGKLAGQYVQREQVRQSVAVFIPSTSAEPPSDAIIDAAVQTDGSLFFLNTGTDKSKGLGYRLCQTCGREVTRKDGRCQVCGGTGEHLHLGHRVNTETLLLRFNPPADMMPMPGRGALDFWHTLQTALVIGATRALQIERSDIGGSLFPVIGRSQEWERSLVLYDNVPGGAGYMTDIRDHLDEVIAEAIRVLRCDYCSEDMSCTRCLRDYGNQNLYPYLRRGGQVLSFLENLLAHRTASVNALGAHTLIANNRTAALWNAIENARRTIHIAVPHIEDAAPPGRSGTWLDLLYERLQAGAQVQLLLSELPQQERDRTSLITADYLNLMMARGQHLELRQAAVLPEWHIIVDADDEKRRRAFRFTDAPQPLSAALNNPAVETTTHPAGIAHALRSFDAMFARARQVKTTDLQAPPKTRVYRIHASSLKTNERSIPALREFFARPVQRMVVCDPYLLDHERIVNRLGAYIDMARDGGALERVDVTTRDAQAERQDRGAQTKAFATLRQKFSDVQIDVNRPTNREHHDRWIEIARADGSRACLHIGRGLDFIRADGTVQTTVLVIEELA